MEELKRSRNYGIDMLRIVSMIMIPILHILNRGGVLASADELSLNYWLANFIEIACRCSVNCYALISGYVLFGKKHKYSSLFNLLFQTMFYTLGVTVVYLIFKPELVDAKICIKAVFPWAYSCYWYLSAYFCLFFIMPVLNYLLEHLSKKEMGSLLGILIFVFSVLPTAFQHDFGYVIGGNSFLWLAVLYLIGGFIKKYDFRIFKRKGSNIAGYLICVLITFGIKFVTQISSDKILGKSISGNFLIEYNSPTILLAALFLFMFFMDLKCGSITRGIAKFFAPVTFGVYLFHEELLIRTYIIKDAFTFIAQLNPIIMILSILGFGLGIWLVGSLVDWLRIKIFELLKIRKLSEYIELKITAIVSKAAKRLSIN